ncbi:hypothetical protein C8R45DRAFT_1160505 [Mycena sanguinolenta]|nr:hypothetical protein C8R45DRAFT_1160505 [Mycena sanguinolenta]
MEVKTDFNLLAVASFVVHAVLSHFDPRLRPALQMDGELVHTSGSALDALRIAAGNLDAIYQAATALINTPFSSYSIRLCSLPVTCPLPPSLDPPAMLPSIICLALLRIHVASCIWHPPPFVFPFRFRFPLHPSLLRLATPLCYPQMPPAFLSFALPAPHVLWPINDTFSFLAILESTLPQNPVSTGVLRPFNPDSVAAHSSDIEVFDVHEPAGRLAVPVRHSLLVLSAIAISRSVCPPPVPAVSFFNHPLPHIRIASLAVISRHPVNIVILFETRYRSPFTPSICPTLRCTAVHSLPPPPQCVTRLARITPSATAPTVCVLEYVAALSFRTTALLRQVLMSANFRVGRG